MRAAAVILLRRLVQVALVALLVGTLCFVMVRLLPGDLAYRIAAGRYGYDLVTREAAEAVRAELGLDRSAASAWVSWISDIFALDLGRSFVSGAPVWAELSAQLGNTILLAVTAVVLSLFIGPPLGLLAALRPRGVLEGLLLGVSVLLRSVPSFVIGILLIIFFAVVAGILPAAGNASWGSLVLPALTLALGLSAVSLQVTRSAMAAVLRSEYFEFALTKGLPFRQVLLRHGLRNAAVPIVAYLGIQTVYLIEGVLVVETLFAWPGIGHALVHAIFGRDVPMVQGTALCLGLLFVTLNTLVDLAVVAIDPRQRKA
jgi:peptide/nickel transport system permease protein